MLEKLRVFTIGFAPEGTGGVVLGENGTQVVYSIPVRRKQSFQTQSEDNPHSTIKHNREFTQQHTFVLGPKIGWLRRKVLKEIVEEVTQWEEIVVGDSRITRVASPYAHAAIEDWQNLTTREVPAEGKTAIIAPLVIFVSSQNKSDHLNNQ